MCVSLILYEKHEKRHMRIISLLFAGYRLEKKKLEFDLKKIVLNLSREEKSQTVKPSARTE